MATETNTPAHNTGNNSLTLGLSLLGGLGMTLMIVGAGIGVIGGENADSTIVGIFVLSGLLMLISGIGAWLAVVRPWENFDDINEAHYHGHHHEEAHHEASEDLLALDASEPQHSLPETTL
ncbi:MAG: hypothetical protein SH821_08785 [Phototrophicales bacterium]|nr:hypothetical protein [Phototrophicales bacterium]